jgi:hypothetical protein
MKAGALLALALLVGCSGGISRTSGDAQAPQDLESAAIDRGLIPDPKDTDIVGLFARDTDRVCIVKAGTAYRIGAYVDYGDRIGCSGAGTVTRSGEALHVELGSEACSFDARFEGERIAFPGALPEGCARLCARRASFAGLEAARLSGSIAEARAMRDANGKQLCGE